MDYMRIYKLTESDFDGIVNAAGGERLSNDDSRESQPNADYLFDDAVVELKFIEEEGLEKKERQQKIAGIFKERFPDKPVVVLDPNLLEKDKQRNYYQALSKPIERCIRKAADQLKQAKDNYPDETKVAILINTGYGSLYHEKFKEIAINRATNVTQQIDSLIVGGIYFYSDGFDHYSFGQFDEIPINLSKRFASFDKLKKQWRDFLHKFMTSAIIHDKDMPPDRLPVLEMDFEVDGVKFVKPAPPMGAPSKFWVHGRPRKNSTGITKCPPVGIIFPKLDKKNWEKFTEREVYDAIFQDTYTEWLKFSTTEASKSGSELKPFVPIEVNYDGFCKKHGEDEISFVQLCEYATEVFHVEINKVIDAAKDVSESQLIIPEYIFLVIEEIGQDKANDLCSIYYVKQSLRQEKIDVILENKQLFFEYGLILASSYAVKYGVHQVRYRRDQKYMWK